MESINDRIRKIRERNSLSQEAFAKSLGLQRNSISLIENGKRNPSDRTIDDICGFYYINKNWLLYGGSDSEIDVKLTHDEELAIYVQDLIDDEDDVIANDIKNFIKLYYGKMDENSKQVLRNIHYDLFSMINKNEEQT